MEPTRQVGERDGSGGSAVPRRSAGRVASPRQPGNRALSQALQDRGPGSSRSPAVLRQAVPYTSPPVRPRSLGPEQVRTALTFYRDQPEIFTAETLAQMRRNLGLVITSPALDEDLVQAVAHHQKEQGGTAEVDGTADGDTLPGLIPFGLRQEPRTPVPTDRDVPTPQGGGPVERRSLDEGPASAFVARCEKRLIDPWLVLSPDGRRSIAEELVNQSLQEQGVPPVKVTLDGTFGAGEGTQAQFRIPMWQIEFGPHAFAQPRMSYDLHIKHLLTSLYHEARHAEQTFTVARLLRGAGLDHEETLERICREGTVAAQKLELAGADPIRPGSPQAAVATQWLQSMPQFTFWDAIKYLLGIGPEIKPLADQAVDAEQELMEARQRWRADPTAENWKAYEEAEAAYEEAYRRYRTQPLEQDAFDTAEAVHRRTTRGSNVRLIRGEEQWSPGELPVPSWVEEQLGISPERQR